MTVMLLSCPVLIFQILVTLHMGNMQHLAKNPFGTLVAFVYYSPLTITYL